MRLHELFETSGKDISDMFFSDFDDTTSNDDTPVVAPDTEDGIYYHGTNNTFDRFDIGAERINRATNIAGIYFTPHRYEAEEYGSNIIEAKLHYSDIFDSQSHNEINTQMQQKALELLGKYTTYKLDWLKSVIIPDFVEAGRFIGGLRDVNGDVKREILLAGGYDAVKDGSHIVILDPKDIERI